MKKTIQFSALIISLLLVSYTSQAGVNSLPEAPAAIDKSTVNIKGGTLPLVIFVNDEYGNPIVGAECEAPCTGLPTQYTNANGEAIFKIPGSCGCHNSPAQVITSTCLQKLSVDCGGNYNITCGD
jgi:hypothetical protein